ncbi:MAG TPA: toll/interleukin-1 receptor domain-containing protein, partial [Vicinamibacterales bacterium]|nr:toll/interleukin-1 receptor domain-containing protein [Vicinamibacterales bacterium]
MKGAAYHPGCAVSTTARAETLFRDQGLHPVRWRSRLLSDDMSFQWEYFIAHAGADLDAAEDLYEHLSGQARVFLDKKCLLLGDDWDRKLAEAQRVSLVTLVLVSSRTEQAYYEREEIAAAIDLARKNEHGHRVIPIYLDAGAETPYGLRLKHSLRLGAALDMADAAAQLLAELPQVKALAGEEAGPVAPPVPAPAPRITLSIAVDQSAAHDNVAAD